MTELLFVLAATICVFAVFLLVFFSKSRSDDGEAARPTCGHCVCHGSEAQNEGSCARLDRTEEEDLRI